MPQVANYHFLSDASFELDAQEVKRLTFNCPPSNQFVKAAAFPILWWRVWPRSNECKYIVVINDVLADPNNIPQNKVVFSMETDTKVLRDIHEIVSGEMFNPGVANSIDFRVVIGKAQFSDVILWHRIQIS